MEYNQGQKKDRSGLLLAALAILSLLLAISIYFLWQEKKKNEEQGSVIAAKTEEVVTAKMKLDSISQQLDLKIAEIQQLGGQVDSLISLKDQISRDRAALQNASTSSKVNIGAYKAKIASYEAILAKKDTEIAKLKEELGVVTTQNQELSQKVTGLETEKSTLKRTLDDSVGSLTSRNQELAQKVTAGSALKARNIVVNAITARGKEKDGGEYRARRVDKLKIDFDLDANPIARSGNREVYLRILDPEGAVMSDMATGSGTFTADGKEYVYTAKQNVDYSNDGSKGSIIYSRGGSPLKKGAHTIQVFVGDRKAGETVFTIK